MKTTVCTKEWMASMVAMPSSSTSQNESLKDSIVKGRIRLDQCYVIVKEEQVICRIVIEEAYQCLTYLTIEDIEEKELECFLQDILHQVDLKQVWRCDLYSDKVHYETIKNVLKKLASQEIYRESYVIETKDIESKSTWLPAYACEQDDLFLLMKYASETTLDKLLQREIQQKGLTTFVQKFQQELLEDEDSKECFQVLIVNEIPVGFISVTRLFHEIGGIGYLGVDHRYQGNQYSRVLLQKAITLAHQHGINKLIGDIDEGNIAIKQALIACGFQLDCKQQVYLFSNDRK